MPRNATHMQGDEGLSPTQVKALDALLSGGTVSDAARTAGVDRSTVHRWLRDDYGFQAAHNQGRQDLLDAVQNRLLLALSAAGHTLTRAIAQGDVKASLALLKGLGFLQGGQVHVGSCCAEDLERTATENARISRMLEL